jgi:hypothetical protein
VTFCYFKELGHVALSSLVNFGSSKIMNCSSSFAGVEKGVDELDRELDEFIRAASTATESLEDSEEHLVFFEAVHRKEGKRTFTPDFYM